MALPRRYFAFQDHVRSAHIRSLKPRQQHDGLLLRTHSVYQAIGMSCIKCSLYLYCQVQRYLSRCIIHSMNCSAVAASHQPARHRNRVEQGQEDHDIGYIVSSLTQPKKLPITAFKDIVEAQSNQQRRVMLGDFHARHLAISLVYRGLATGIRRHGSGGALRHATSASPD